MTQARVAVGVIVALLVVGAVLHYQPVPTLSDGSFVSAAGLDIETLLACKALGPTLAADTPGTPYNGQTVVPSNVALYVEKDGPCVCKKSICTNSRVCDVTGDGQCYIPRCPGHGTDIPISYKAGCFCAASSLFTSSDPAKAFVGEKPTAVCIDAVAATEDCSCGTEAVCYKGEFCGAGNKGACGPPPGNNLDPKPVQEIAFAVPSIEKWGLLGDKVPNKVKICKSTVTKTYQCKLPTPTQTQNTDPEAEPECELQTA